MHKGPFFGGRRLQELIERHVGQDGGSGPASTGAWEPEEIRHFQALLRQAREELGYSPRLLEQELGYYSDGKYVRMLEGQWPSIPLRTPSRRFLQRLQGWLLAGPEPLPPWSPLISLRCEHAAIPLRRILAAKRQCPECVAEWAEGRREERDTWWVYGHPRQRFCSKAHRRRWSRRDEAERRRALALMEDAGRAAPTPDGAVP